MFAGHEYKIGMSFPATRNKPLPKSQQQPLSKPWFSFYVPFWSGGAGGGSNSMFKYDAPIAPIEESDFHHQHQQQHLKTSSSAPNMAMAAAAAAASSGEGGSNASSYAVGSNGGVVVVHAGKEVSIVSNFDEENNNNNVKQHIENVYRKNSTGSAASGGGGGGVASAGNGAYIDIENQNQSQMPPISPKVQQPHPQLLRRFTPTLLIPSLSTSSKGPSWIERSTPNGSFRIGGILSGVINSSSSAAVSTATGAAAGAVALAANTISRGGSAVNSARNSNVGAGVGAGVMLPSTFTWSSKKENLTAPAAVDIDAVIAKLEQSEKSKQAAIDGNGDDLRMNDDDPGLLGLNSPLPVDRSAVNSVGANGLSNKNANNLNNSALRTNRDLKSTFSEGEFAVVDLCDHIVEDLDLGGHEDSKFSNDIDIDEESQAARRSVVNRNTH